ncbi:MAG: thioredoxin family protein [Pelomonas sp.]|nr:thioredoxin family protein [Roseateles sp.]
MPIVRATVLALALAAALPAAHAVPEPVGVAWQEAGVDADVDRAFATAREQNKPLLLYWGAKWCPPCNQLKATLFKRQDFIERTRAFVAVHIDGDAPGAQKLGARFKVVGYPTMILFNPAGAELTRLPGEIDAAQVVQVMQLGLAGGRPVKDVLADARAGRQLGANEWRLLAYYSWETDEAQLVDAGAAGGMLTDLAIASQTGGADAETTTRLWLRALAMSDAGHGVKPDAALTERVRGVLADPARTRAEVDVLANYADAIVRVLAPEPDAAQQQLVGAFDAALARLQDDATLSRGDRVTVLDARIALARLNQPRTALNPKMPAPLVADARAMAARFGREIGDGYERQAVLPEAADMLADAGLWKDSDALLKANLGKSHAPYYFMSKLGGNARRQGRTADALHWYGEAYARSEGPATRLQWGSSYLAALVELAPQDSRRIEGTATELIDAAAKDPAAFYERSARSLQRAGGQLGKWAADGHHAEVMARLKTRLDAVCAKLDAADGQQAACAAVIK